MMRMTTELQTSGSLVGRQVVSKPFTVQFNVSTKTTLWVVWRKGAMKFVNSVAIIVHCFHS